MYQSPLLKDLQARGLIAQTTDADALDEMLAQGSVTLYCGFDPTADSLHLGHLVPVLVLKRFQQAGHKPIALVGGATGMIGDPSFKATERKLNTPEVIAGWVEKIRGQVSPFLAFDGENAAIMANNYDWFGGMGALEFLRDIGKHFSVNAMIKRESVQQRLNRDEAGISYTEFSYALLQGYDFAELYQRHGCVLQIGGSDQWGNITAGTNLTRRMHQAQVYGLTLPLVTKSDGTKFGKTESGAIWLDPKKTSPYAFYQFWLNTADADVYKFMRYFTFLSVEEIEAIEAADKAAEGRPQAQRILAEQATELVHGKAALEAAQRISASLFSGDLAALTEADLAQLAQDGVPGVELGKEVGSLVDALVATGLAKSKTEARSFIQSGSVAINGAKVDAVDHAFAEAERLFGRFTLLRRGKKLYAMIRWA
ncbi:MAG: tyrosine--tRNA ligase [Candidatus Dactylopiibacterium carminicum]|uniref:Tyrosine--tRNA ligase n=1 Tax=Candidatus Dactylopiibacterium carminicum TaxID=857335 RepID=A0A272EPN4_9RHOO|nr:tyrosine--tRNA ligase [Candidatus Dactylopiibacterium carminicum]KAF7598334.1 tyrosine--tRNA ligase [Candidatus Dactylopiibacterium carminicum]PAS92048.1 MAG: tyrosine--tRNA ligase [Candidatus Dactylopiibacterium carminicum]PAS95475.1 MAG: tyrosine--tRNA ligase [Candidatus Dactylopiibacterium carminicum]PAS97386.1 MAG: tyrosine--tRNA ligase [Candidatus Dactylopiibacterium carminicum]